MSATADTPLGGFEQRLLTRLRAEIAARPALESPVAEPARPALIRRLRAVLKARDSRRRIPVAATAAIAALAVAVLSALPAAAPSLAQAFPILTERGHVLPGRLARALRAQWLTGAEPRFDFRHAYAFSTPAGTGYVVVDQRTRWLCILVPGFTHGSAGGRCERVTLARIAEPALSVRITGRGRQEIVSLLPRGAGAASLAPASPARSGDARKLTLHHGVLAIVSRKPATVITTVDGHSSSTTYTP
jgi:hypothetical protein